MNNISDLREELNSINLWNRGIISRRGPRNNQTDCESDIILIHVSSMQAKRFHGTFYHDNYIQKMHRWMVQYPILKQSPNANQLFEAYNKPIHDLLEKIENE